MSIKFVGAQREKCNIHPCFPRLNKCVFDDIHKGKAGMYATYGKGDSRVQNGRWASSRARTCVSLWFHRSPVSFDTER
jgi:hypothetical protein